ncbi:acetyl esterase/lipase [Chitinophaga skermanii]|uniref:Acetyl esterase/lipase n=1 Tax=Chitinophaga skermanii TaxID=331697 RepID=A0A327Q4L7_9BACT|nr:alpha/beta hydrolase [Chitinophaga skermanii]RAI98717.1 acetyl esterase/lipase [Chitinophaga skermanii]
MKKVLFTGVCILVLMVQVMAQERIILYPGQQLKIGGAEKISDAPHLDYYKSKASNRSTTAVLICPGGAYTKLAVNHEGKDVAKFFNDHGYDAFVLKYRLNDGDQQGSTYPAQWNDATTAIRYIKSHAKDYNIDPAKVGVLGFSAGGHLASSLATIISPAQPNSTDLALQFSSRPAFAVLVYPVISLNTDFKHAYSAEMLLGKNYSVAMADSLSTDKRVSAETPPTMLIHSTDDKAVPVENSIFFYNALRAHNIPASMHIYDHGGHGYGMAPTDKVLNTWPQLCITWLQQLNL